MPHRLTAASALLLATAPLRAQPDTDPAAGDLAAVADAAPAAPAARPWALTVISENDSPYYKWNSSDRYYTNGLAVSFAHQPRWAEDLAPYVPFAEQFGPARTAAGYVAGQLIFTPDDITAEVPDPADRPYAGYLFGGVYWQRQSTGDAVPTLDHIQLDLGVVGPSSFAEGAQRNIHNVFGGDEPNGWDAQLRDEPTAQLTVRKKWRLDVLTPEPDADGLASFGVQIIPDAGVTVGNVWRYAELGATARLGVNLPDDFGPARINNLASFTGAQKGDGRWSAYIFGRATGRAVEHDLTLEGNSYKDSASVDAEPLVGELQAGFEVAYQWQHSAFTLGYSQTFLTEQFEGQDGWHSFGAYVLRFVTRF